MKRLCAVLLAWGLWLTVLPTGALAAGGDDCVGTCPRVGGGEGVIDVVYKRGQSDFVPGRGRPEDGPREGKTTWITVKETAAPTCPGNGLLENGILCGAAVNTCADGLVRFWIWHQVTRHTRNADGTVTSVEGPWEQEPGVYCLGADDPEVPTIARVLDEVRTSFTSLPLRVQVPRADPAPTTLVNVKTAFSAGSDAEQVFDLTPLGTPVRVRARPVKWTWTWGDGQRASFNRPGIPKQPDVTHVYERAGELRASVVVEWRGTFTVGSDPEPYTIQTPAFVRSAPIPVRVREARAQLVR